MSHKVLSSIVCWRTMFDQAVAVGLATVLL